MILIYWKGKVGSAVASLCEYKGISYDVRDDSDNLESFESYEYIIPSPWIPGTHRIYQSDKIFSELDFAYQFLPKDFKIISVTWTDGKSTTAWIMYNILEKEYSVKKPVYLSGNFDIPFSATILDILKKWEKWGIIVLEISSFMSFMLTRFESDYSIFTNFKPDHLNWHMTLQEYLDAKINILRRTKIRTMINKQVYDFAWENWLTIARSENVRIFGNDIDSRDATDGNVIKISGRKKYILSETQFSGQHNAMNILSCALIANEMKICSKRTKVYLKEITWLPHRLEIIGKKRWITIVEDSKSTSSQSLEAALSSFWSEKTLLLIAWGSDKWDSFGFLEWKFQDRVKALACIWATKAQFAHLAQALQIPYISTDSLDEGVIFLSKKGSEWDTLMLSPGCASFGLFRDYLDRANQFRACIKKLPD
jgi:UDP-N-acetylmuramoylalanine--D-glutamate ligase